MALRSVRVVLENRTSKQESDLLVRESEVGISSHFSGSFQRVCRGPHFVDLGTNVKKMDQNEDFPCGIKLQKVGKS